jgi:hypothetical protein
VRTTLQEVTILELAEPMKLMALVLWAEQMVEMRLALLVKERRVAGRIHLLALDLISS